MNNYNAEIERYMWHFEKDFSQVKNLQVTDNYHSAIYKKMIYVGIIDALSKCIFPRRGNRDRFVNFLKKFSDWDNGHKISLPHLFQLLQKTQNQLFQN